jgi:uncharacterized protein (TIGR02145 family)
MTTVVAVLVLVTGLSAGSLVAQRPSSDAPPERLVDVGGQRLYVRCAGPTEGGPTVILEAGAGEHSSAWSRVQELLSPQARSCAYDRAGWGRSEPGPAPRSMTQEAFELRTLLDSAGIAGPYILVGHSYGGLLVRRYVERYGDDVVGLVLVDPTHEDDRLGVVGEGWVRIRERATGHPIPAPRALQRGEEPATGYDPWRDLWPDEFQQLYRARQADPAQIGDRPLIVIAGERERTAPPGTSADLWRDLQAEKIRQMSDLAELSTNGSLVRDPSSGHRVHVDNPELVRSAIHAVIQGIDPSTSHSRLMPDGKWWMTRNLNVDVAGSYCYDNRDAHCHRYGRLYTWEAARRACRSLGNGWRLPSNDEWRHMAKRFGGVYDDSDDGGRTAYRALSLGGSSGFDALLGGGRSPDEAQYARLEAHGFYWTASEGDSATAWFYNFGRGGRSLNRHDDGEKGRAFSVRCVRD